MLVDKQSHAHSHTHTYTDTVLSNFFPLFLAIACIHLTYKDNSMPVKNRKTAEMEESGWDSMQGIIYRDVNS